MTFRSIKARLKSIEGMPLGAVPRLAALAVLCRPQVDIERVNAWNELIPALEKFKRRLRLEGPDPRTDAQDTRTSALRDLCHDVDQMLLQGALETAVATWSPSSSGWHAFSEFHIRPNGRVDNQARFILHGIDLLRQHHGCPMLSKRRAGACDLVAQALVASGIEADVFDFDSMKTLYMRHSKARRHDGHTFQLDADDLADLDEWAAQLDRIAPPPKR